ncbi:MAG TPA: hypothetical protein VMG59_12635 [Phycisphaerae bacterium]|nr:hypothetical protein [Phycisphaerae bacterium]
MRYRGSCLWILVLAAVLAVWLTGCSSATSSPHADGLCHGSAQVVSVNQWMWSAQVVYEGQEYTIWWDNSSMLFYNNLLTTPTLAAKPGDVINFNGFLSDGEIYLGREWIGTSPPVATPTPSQSIVAAPPKFSSPRTPDEPVPGGISPLPVPYGESPAPASTGITPLPLPANGNK